MTFDEACKYAYDFFLKQDSTIELCRETEELYAFYDFIGGLMHPSRLIISKNDAFKPFYSGVTIPQLLDCYKEIKVPEKYTHKKEYQRKVYVYSKNNIPIDYDDFCAMTGFRDMGYEIVFFSSLVDLINVNNVNRKDIVLGPVSLIDIYFREIGVIIDGADYPESIRKYLGRKIWKSTIYTISSQTKIWPIFVKPIEKVIFRGRVIDSPMGLIGCGYVDSDTDIYCSEVVDLMAEYRVFILYGEIIDVRRYAGRWDVCIDKDIVEACIKDYADAPNAYALDFGVTNDGRTLLIEVNNTCSIGSYGLEPHLYAKFISARWSELVDCLDECK